MIAEFGPGGVGADFDGFDLGGPVLGEEDVVDVVGAIFDGRGGRCARVRDSVGLVEVQRRAIKPGSFATLPSSLSASRMTFEEAQRFRGGRRSEYRFPELCRGAGRRGRGKRQSERGCGRIFRRGELGRRVDRRGQRER